MPDGQMIPAPVTWAQRKNVVFVTFCVEDCSNPEVKIESERLHFHGTGGTEKRTYENNLDLYDQIDIEKSRHFIRDRVIECILTKKEEGPFWPRLLKEKTKMHWLKVDFARWKDEDETDDEMGNEGGDLSEMMRQMGGLGGGEDRPSFDDFDAEASDSDDDQLPDLE